jgi:cytochrome c-type biogenesis protein CcmH
MSLWIVLAALTALSVAWIAWPLVRPRANDGQRADYDAAVYFDQLQELERDRERGVIDDVQAGAARIEIERRLLATGRNAGAAVGGAPRRHIALAAALAVALPLVAFPAYLDLGAPDLPGQPFAGRAPAPDEAVSPIVAAARDRLDAATAQAEANPDDAQAWFDLGRLRLVAGEVGGALDALARARELAPDRPEIASAHGEALTRDAEGLVTGEARRAFEAALAGNETDPRARYFLALGDYQAGREQAALEAWAELAKGAPADAAWLPTVVARVEETARALGHDPADWLPAETAPARGPTQEDIAAARDLDPEAQNEMIRGMVEGLAARLADTPDDVEGWRQLGRSRDVLGEPAAAAAAYRRALEIEPGHPETLLLAALASSRAGDDVTARAFFVQLLAIIPPEADAHRIVSEAIARIDAAAGR